MQSASTDEALQLRDGRKLAYCGYGGRNRAPVFFFHGWPGSRLEFANDQAASEAGARVISVDRPRIGRSLRDSRRRAAGARQDNVRRQPDEYAQL